MTSLEVEKDPSSDQAYDQMLPIWRRQPFVFSLFTLFFTLQMWLPYRYYLSDYPWDERFAWRMFSTVRSLNCQIQAWEGAAEGQSNRFCPNGQDRCVSLSLSKELHMVWVNLLKRGRREVLQHYVEQRCKQRPKPLYISLNCPHPEDPHPLISIQSPNQDLCAHPEALLSKMPDLMMKGRP